MAGRYRAQPTLVVDNDATVTALAELPIAALRLPTDLASALRRLGFDRIPLDIVGCPDRRIERAAAEVVARHLLDGDTEVSLLMPKREYTRFWHRLVHDGTADSIAKTPHGLLSRGVAGTVGSTLVVNLAGSPGACRDGYAVLRPALTHALKLLADQKTATDHVHT